MSDALPQDRTENHRKSPAASCLWPLLSALEWAGEPRHLYEALPNDAIVSDFESLRAVLANLNFNTVSIKESIDRVGDDEFPALLLTSDEDVWVIIERAPSGAIQIFKGREGRLATIEPSTLNGQLFLVRQAETEASNREMGRFGWLSILFDRERPTIRLLVVVTFLINCLALSLPLYLLTVFDLAIGARSTMTLATLGGVVAILIIAEVALREIRAQAIAQFATRTQNFVMASVFERILRMPIAYVENASVAGQLNRLRAFESVREIFSGPVAASLLDIPLIAVFVIAVFVLGGSLGWLIVIFIGAILLLAMAFVPRVRIQTKRAGSARSEIRLFRNDFTRHLATLRDSGAETIWMQRYRNLVAHQLAEAFSVQKMSFTEQTLAQAFSIATGALIIGFGALRVIDGELSIGALTAVMAIVWRVLSPIQTVLLNIGRVFQSLDTAKQINQLMTLTQESKTAFSRSYQHIRGDIALENVAYRAGSQGLPILRGIDLIIRAGELVVLTGAPGPSRSTVLKLIANLNQASSGRIRIDDCDVRQFNVRELRRCIALVNDEQIIFSDTLAQNLLLANPLAEEHEIREALIEADLLKFVEQLSDGLQTDLTGLLSAGLSASINQKIKLARAYLLAPPIYLFDEPTKDLNPSGQSAFLKKLHALKGQATVVVRTSDQRILKLADKAVFLHAGRILEGPSVGRTTTPPDADRKRNRNSPRERAFT